MKPLARAVALALAAHQGALAQDGQVAAMASVEVVAAAPLAGLGIDRKLLPYVLQWASGEQIARGDNLTDFMARNLTGVNVNEIAGSPFQNDITYRGFRASPVLGAAQGISVFLDGVRVNEPFGDVVNWDMLPEAAISNVLLVPGSNPVYGLNTLGGALALATKSGVGDPGLEAQLSTGSGGRKRVDLAYGASSAERWHSFLGATLFDEDGWRAHSQGQLANVFIKFGRDAWSVSLLGARSRLRGNGLLPDAMYRQDRRSIYTFPDQTRNRLLQMAFNARLRIDDATVLTALAYARHSRRDTISGDVEDEGEGVLNTTSTRQSSQGASVLLSARRRVHQFDIGATFDRSSVTYAQFSQAGELTPQREVVADGENAPGAAVTGRARAFGLFAADTWTLAPGTHLTASARINAAQVTNTIRLHARESFTYTGVYPSLGIVRGALFANLAQGNRVPTVIELGCADPQQPCQLPVGLQSDPYLKQVVARTVEAGVRGRRMSLSLYRTVNRDDILFLSAGTSHQGYFANFGRTRHQGVDASANVKRGSLALRASYSYLDAVYDTDGVLFSGARNVPIRRGTRIAGLPAHTLKLGADWQVTSNFKLGSDAQITSSMSTQGNEDELIAHWRVGGHALLNLRASWEPAPRWELYARVNNLSDRRYESFGAVARNQFAADASNARFVAPGAPRSVAFGLRYRY
ncbi:MAG: TonB-dependent receptor [Pseudomonadota bacterium]